VMEVACHVYSCQYRLHHSLYYILFYFFNYLSDINLDDEVGDIDNTVHKAGSGIGYRYTVDSSTESESIGAHTSDEIIIENGQLSHDNDKTNSLVGNNDDNNDNSINNHDIGDNNKNSNIIHNDNNNVIGNNGSNRNRDNDRHGIAECSAVCLDGQPTMIIEHDKLDAGNNLSSEYFENSETDDIVDNRTMQNTVFEKDDSVQGQVKKTVTDSVVSVGETWIDGKGVVCVKKTHKHNNTSRIVSQQKRYQDYHSQKFQLKELDIAKKLTASILKTEFEVPVSPLLCSLSISPPYTPTRKREYLVPDAAKIQKLKSDTSNENLNDKTKITNVLNDVSDSDDYKNIDVENFHRDFEAKYRRNVTTNLGKSNTDSDDDCINIRKNNESDIKNNNNDNINTDNNDNDDNNDDTVSSAPLCVGPLKIPSLLAVAVDEVVWAELTRLGDGSKVLEIYSMSDQKPHNVSTKNTDINTNSDVTSSGGAGVGADVGGSGCDEKENDIDNGSSCSMLLVASYTIIPDKYRVISKQRSRQAVGEIIENDITNGNDETNSDDSESQHTFIRNCDSVGDDDRGGGNEGVRGEKMGDEREKGEKEGNADEKMTNQLQLLDSSSLSATIIKHSQELVNNITTHTDLIPTSSREEDKIFTTVDSPVITYGFQIFNPYNKGDVRTSLQPPSSFSSNVVTGHSNVQVTEKMEKKIVDKYGENMIRSSPTYVKIEENKTDRSVDDDSDSAGRWMLFWCESESDCAEWMVSLRSA
jgi:hypothetical protein